MAIDLPGALSRIELALEQLGRSVVLAALRPGLRPSETGRLLEASGLPVDASIGALYAWSDGTQTAAVTLDDIQIFPGFYFLSLADAIANYQAFVADSRWDVGSLPLFANGGGDFYFVDLMGKPSGMVRRFRIDAAEQPVEFLSLGEMVCTLTAAFERGVFFVDPHGYLEMDDLQFSALAAELNPGVAWWTD